jgi:sulfur carrier protein ThiS
MKLRVRLYGTLSQQVPNYQHSQGIEVEVPDGARVKDLLARLAISESQGAVVAMEGRLLKADDTVRGGAPLHVLQPLAGG